MGIHPNDVSTDALLQQAGWLTALARRLVRDPAEADDVAQETMLVALSSDQPAPRRWLAHVARNIARARARSRTARNQRESTRDVPHSAPSSAELAEKLEAQRLLVEAVRDLDEPYRKTILLHYWEHKTSEEIAALENIAPSTVRWRLKQGVDALRRRLDAKHDGDRRAWSALLLPLYEPTGKSLIATTSIVTGVLGMKLVLQTMVAAVVIFVVGAGVWLARRPTELHAVPQISKEPQPAQLDDPTVHTTPTTALSTTREATSPPSPTPNPERTKIEPIATAHLEARILDESSLPIRGAVISQRSGEAKSAPSDAAGRIAFDVAHFSTRGSDSFRLTAEGHAMRMISARLQSAETTYLGDLVMQPGGSVSGRILDEHDAPIAGASVGLDRLDSPDSELTARAQWRYAGEPSTTSAADGTYRIDGAPVAPCRVVSFAPAHEAGQSAIVELRANEVTSGIDVDLPALSTDRMLRGIVLDPDGQPVPRARVNFHYSRDQGTSGGSFDADQHGRFDEIVQPGIRAELFAHDEKGRWSDATASDVRPSDKDVVLQFRPAQWVELVVTDADHKPIEKWHGQLQAADHSHSLSDGIDGNHPDGTTKLQVPSVPFLLDVEARAYAKLELGPFDPAHLGARIDVVLQSVHGISGRVVSVAGPVSNARVRLFAAVDGRVEHNGFIVSIDPNSRDDVRTGEDGTFTLSPRDVGQWIVRAEAEGFAPTEKKLVGYDAERGADGVELILSAGGAIAGRVLPQPDHEAVGTVVAISRGDGFARTQRVGPDGAFSFDHLMPGRWNVSRRSEELNPLTSSTSWQSDNPVEVPWNCEVLEGRTAHFDLGADSVLVCALIGKLSVQDARLGLWNAQFANEPNGSHSVMLDSAGSFRLERAEAGQAQLLLNAVSGPFEGTRYFSPITLVNGNNDWNTVVSAATLSLHGSGSGSKDPLLLVVQSGDFACFVRQLTDVGDVDITVPAGDARILRVDVNTKDGGNPRYWTGGMAVKLVPGESVSIERP